MVFGCVCVCVSVYYLNLLSAQHRQLPHVPERLKQVVVELSRRLQQPSVRLVLLGVHLQQLHHAVHGSVSVQHLGREQEEKTWSWEFCGATRWSAGFRDQADDVFIPAENHVKRPKPGFSFPPLKVQICKTSANILLKRLDLCSLSCWLVYLHHPKCFPTMLKTKDIHKLGSGDMAFILKISNAHHNCWVT